MPKKAKTVKESTSKKESHMKKETVKKSKKVEKSDKKSKKSFEPLRGMKDLLPKQSVYWLYMLEQAKNIVEAYGYEYIETPILETAPLFVKSLGKGTDVIDKEMYVFDDKDGKKVALRPEFTASTVRSYISNGMLNRTQPVKVWTHGPLFRHDRPQAGRYRQFHQLNCEVIGERDAVIDAELITIAYNYINDLGISAEVHINSIGTAEDRKNYTIELVGYLRSKRSYLSEDSRNRLNKNPLRILDSKDAGDQEILQEAPQIIDWLSVESKKFFMQVLEYLDELQIPYVLQPTLVRGLDYYTDTVFEIYQEGTSEASQSALGGGGRYDGLVEQLGGREGTPASGFGLGLERILLAMKQVEKEKETTLVPPKERKIFFAQLGVQARRRSLALIEQLRRTGIVVGSSLAKGSLRGQLDLANKGGATHAVILGQKEVQEGTVIIRDMSSGIQEIIDQKKLEKELRKLI